MTDKKLKQKKKRKTYGHGTKSTAVSAKRTTLRM